MRLRDVMRRKVETISPRDSAAAAFDRMRSARIRHLVVKDGRKIVGILSDRDVGTLGSLGQVETVEDRMTAPPVCVSPDLTVREAANLMRGRTMSCLPVVEDGKIVGIVTVTDLLKLLGSGIERPVPKARRWILKDRGPRRHPASRGRPGGASAPR
ncbi:MAG TPA: CBS domain-containing protein [Thermoanaerobaculia bacterium]|nr:CBS domain-containing protein [Thermoanaerobaculia bacterium]